MIRDSRKRPVLRLRREEKSFVQQVIKQAREANKLPSALDLTEQAEDVGINPDRLTLIVEFLMAILPVILKLL